MTDKEILRPLYMEFQGYLSQIPLATEKDYMEISHKPIWERHNNAVNELSELSGSDYSEFKVTDYQSGYGAQLQVINTLEMRHKLGGLISRLYGEYFKGELAPFGGTPSTVINTSQSQSQVTQVEVVNQFQVFLDEKISKQKTGSNERKFLEKLKSAAGTAKSVADLVRLGMSIADKFGLTADQAAGLLT